MIEKATDIVRHEEIVASEQLPLLGPDGAPLVDEEKRERRIAVPAKGYGPKGLRLTGSQEAFCTAYVFGGVELMGNAAASYEHAYGTRDYANASRLLKQDHIAERIDELTAERNRAQGLTKEQWVESLRDLGLEAKRAGQYSPAIRAFEIIGKAAGYLDDRVSITHHDGRSVQEKMLDIADRLAGNPAVVEKLIAQRPELAEHIRRIVSVRTEQIEAEGVEVVEDDAG